MKRYPSIDVIIPTLNEEKNLESCLKPIFRQDYPGRLRVTIIDGGSDDSTVKIAKESGCRVLHNEEKLAEPAVFKGMESSDCDLCCVIAVDNIIVNERDFFRNMVKPFMERNVTGAFPLITFSDEEPGINKYISFRAEAFSEFMYGKACNILTFRDVYDVKQESRDYVIFDFLSSDFPLLALAQGFMIDRKRFKRNPASKHSDIQPIIDIIKKGEDIAYVKSAMVYHYQISGIGSFIRKFQWRIKNNLEGSRLPGMDARRDFRKKKVMWGIYSATFIFPLMYSLYKIAETKRGFYIYHFITNLVLLFLIPYVFLKLRLGKVWGTYK